METLKIAIISSSMVLTPPINYGTEIATYWLARELAKKHEVYLYAPLNESKYYKNMNARRIPCTYGLMNYELESKALEWYSKEILSLDVMLDISSTLINTELIHWKYPHMPHAFYKIGMSFSNPRIGRHNAVVQSLLQKEYALKGIDPFFGSPLQSTMGFYPGTYKDAKVINYGIPLNEYEYSEDKEDYILYLSRFHISKGFDQAIKLAKELKFKLVMAGSTEFPDHLTGFQLAYDLADGDENIKFVLNPSQQEKIELLKKASALILPTQEAEAFGLIILEALATGTPVLTNKQFITEELKPAVYDINESNIRYALKKELPYKKNREYAEKFSVERFASNFEDLLKQVANKITWGE